MEVAVSPCLPDSNLREKASDLSPAKRTPLPLGWIVAAILALVLFLVLLLTETQIRMFSTRIDAYKASRDNRFASWPWSADPNPNCPVPATAIAAIGWDPDGHSHALIAPSYIVTTHNDPPRKIHFRAVDGKRHTRRVIETFTHSQDPTGRPFIRFCKLDHPVPPTIHPLPVLNPPDQSRITKNIFIVGRHGRIAREFNAVARLDHCFDLKQGKFTTRGMLVTEPGDLRPGQIRLRLGDSGAPVLVRTNGGWALAAVACAVSTGRTGNRSFLEHIYAMPGPHIAAMNVNSTEIQELPWAQPPPPDNSVITESQSPGRTGIVDSR